MPQTINEALTLAITLCLDNTSHEEKGGLILTNGKDFEFHQLENSLTGQQQARVLYSASKEDYAKKIYERNNDYTEKHNVF